MKKLPLILSALFLMITLARVAAFVSDDLNAGLLGWIFSIGLGVSVFAWAYWTRVKTTRIAALVGLLFFIAVDATFNMIEVWTSITSVDPLIRGAALVYGAFPTVAVALAGWLTSRIALSDRASGHENIIDAIIRRGERTVSAWADHGSDKVSDNPIPETQASETIAEPVKTMPYVCGSCGEGFVSSGAYANHKRWKHSNGHKVEKLEVRT